MKKGGGGHKTDPKANFKSGQEDNPKIPWEPSSKSEIGWGDLEQGGCQDVDCLQRKDNWSGRLSKENWGSVWDLRPLPLDPPFGGGRVAGWWQGGAEHSFSRLVPPLLAPLLPRLLRTTISNFGEHSLLTQTLHLITEQKLGLTPPSYQELKNPV